MDEQGRIRELERKVIEQQAALDEHESHSAVLREALDALPYAVSIVNVQDRRVLWGNRVSGFKGQKDLTCHALSHDQDHQCGSHGHPCPIDIVQRTGSPTSVDHIHYGKDRKAEMVEVQAFPLRAPDGRVDRIVEMSVNVTEMRQRERRLQHSAELLAKLNHATSRLMESPKEEDAYQVALRAAHDLIGPGVCAVYRPDKEGAKETGTSSIPGVDDLPTLLSSDIVSQCYAKGDMLLFHERSRMPEAWQRVESVRWGGVWAVPEVGAFVGLSVDASAMMAERIDLIHRLAGQLSQTVRRIRRSSQLEVQAMTDPLTGAYNRRVLDELLRRETRLAKSHSQDLCLVMVDLDGFKNVNDLHGHLAGDRVLMGVAEIIHAQMRASDRVVRYGGDEFLLLIPASRDEATQIVNRIKADLREQNEIDAFGLSGDFISLSVGIAVWHPEAAQPISDVIGQADHLMYASKRHSPARN